MLFADSGEDFCKIQTFPSRFKYFGKITGRHFPFDTVEKESNLRVEVSVYFLDEEETIDDAIKKCEAAVHAEINHPSLSEFLKLIADEKDRAVYSLSESFTYSNIDKFNPETIEDCAVIMKHYLELTRFLGKRGLTLCRNVEFCIERDEKSKIKKVVFPRSLTGLGKSSYCHQNHNFDSVFLATAKFAYRLFQGYFLQLFFFRGTYQRANGDPRMEYLDPLSPLLEYDDDLMVFVKTLLFEKSFNFESVMQTQLMKKAGIELDLSENFTKKAKVHLEPRSSCIKKENPKAENLDSMATFLSLCRQDPEQLMKFECKGGEKVEAIINLMSTLSPVIKNAINTKNDFYNPATNTFQIFGFDPKNMQKMVEFCESSSIQETAGSEIELLEIASFFEIDILKSYAAKLCIEAVTNVNVIEMFQLAKKLKNSKFEKYCIQHGAANPSLFMTANVDNVFPDILHQFFKQIRGNVKK